jgi:TPR repeat protein
LFHVWREGIDGNLSEQKLSFECVRELRGRLVDESGEARREVSLEKRIETEQNCPRFCELCYRVHGCVKSPDLGGRFLRLAADSGHSDAQHRYSGCHIGGLFANREDSKRWRHAEMSGSTGNVVGQLRCGYCLENGLDVAKDLPRAVGYCKLSAGQGFASGQSRYGRFLMTGCCVAKDDVKAAQCYKSSADQGRAAGQCSCATFLHNGEGAGKDLEKAAQYYKSSADQGYTGARDGYMRCGGRP